MANGVAVTQTKGDYSMRVGNRWIIAALTFLCVAGSAGRVSAQHALNHIHHALWELKDARLEIKESKWHFGEHKVKAEIAIDNAIKQIDLVLLNAGEFGRGEWKRRELREEYKRFDHHPHLHFAVVELRLAHKELQAIKHNFGGHKEAALRDIDIAANQIEILIKNAKR
jgi:hypothetical protein